MREYVEGMGRNPGEEYQHSHLYEVLDDGYMPMCGYGWNRSDGYAFSILRGWTGAKGICKVCSKRAEKNLPGVDPMPHKTKWL